MPSRTTRCIPLLVAVLILAGCGSSTTTTTVTTTITETSSSAAPTTNTPTSASTSAGTASSSATSATGSGSPTPACRTAHFSLRFLGQQGATGHGELGFALKNTGSHSCETIGYPGVLFLDKAGRPLPTIPDHTTHDFVGSAPLAKLTVAPGASVSFRLGVTHGVTSTAGCTTAYGLQVIAPNDTATLSSSIPAGAYQCQKTTVSPLQPGNSAYR